MYIIMLLCSLQLKPLKHSCKLRNVTPISKRMRVALTIQGPLTMPMIPLRHDTLVLYSTHFHQNMPRLVPVTVRSRKYNFDDCNHRGEVRKAIPIPPQSTTLYFTVSVFRKVGDRREVRSEFQKVGNIRARRR